MAASLKAQKKMQLDYNVDRAIYDGFVKVCAQKGFAPAVVVERLIKKYTETGQI
mgnify:CR=1 FL=1